MGPHLYNTIQKQYAAAAAAAIANANAAAAAHQHHQHPAPYHHQQQLQTDNAMAAAAAAVIPPPLELVGKKRSAENDIFQLVFSLFNMISPTYTILTYSSPSRTPPLVVLRMFVCVRVT